MRWLWKSTNFRDRLFQSHTNQETSTSRIPARFMLFQLPDHAVWDSHALGVEVHKLPVLVDQVDDNGVIDQVVFVLLVV